MNFFKKYGRIAESVFGVARQKNSGSPPADSSAPVATEQPTLHAATTNAGEGQVNFQSLQQPTAQQQAAAKANPNGTPMAAPPK